MILQSVPCDDYDETDAGPQRQTSSEDACLYGHSTGRLPRSTVRRTRRALAPGSATDSGSLTFRLALVGICCCLAIVGIGASLTLLSRYATETEGTTKPVAPSKRGPVVLAVFSYAASPTNAALAWLTAALLTQRLPNATAAAAAAFSLTGRVKGPFIPDGHTVKVWRPPPAGGAAGSLQALAHGEVSQYLQTYHGLGPPRVRDLNSPDRGVTKGAQPSAKAMPEADAFLAVRKLLPQVKLGGTVNRRELVIVSHPHHLPYLMALAWASGFQARALDPAAYGSVPWERFGCDALGYPNGTSPRAGVEREAERLGVYVDALRGQDPQQLAALEPVVSAANKTLTFYRCAAGACPR